MVSTPITDVIRSYGDNPAVHIADSPETFMAAMEAALAMPRDEVARHADAALADMSWDTTWNAMHMLMQDRLASAHARNPSIAAHNTGAPHYDVLIVGAGFAGSVMAERLAAGAGKRVRVIDKRPHICGNAYDCHNEAGVLIHQYGPHIFHTNSDAVVEYLSRFTFWRPYEHRVLAHVQGQLVPIPINITTLERPWSFGLLAAIVTLAGSCAVGVQWSMKLIVDAMAASGSRGDGAVAPVALSWSGRA